MTDYSELIEDLLVNGLGYGFQVADLTQRAAKALEAQAKEIAELKEMMRALIIIVEFSNMADSSRKLTSQARAALAVAEPVIREECAKIIEPSFPRPCDCEGCYCGIRDDAERVSAWDEAAANAKAIREGDKNDSE